MHVQFGNTAPLDNGERMDTDAPHVTYVNLHEYEWTPGITPDELKLHLADAILTNQGITNLPGQEALVALLHTEGVVAKHSAAKPTWVWSDDEQLGLFLASYFGCSAGIPEDVEDTHHTLAGPPGVVPGTNLDLEMNMSATGHDNVARCLGGGGVGLSGVSTTAPTSTTYTLDGKTTSLNQYQGQRIVCGSTSVGAVWGNIVSNTAATPGVLTVDQWYNAATPGGAAATTPLAGPYAIIDGAAPSWFVGISASTTALGTPTVNSSLPGEIVTAGGGLIRKIAPYAHTAAATTWTLTPVFTANGSDTLPVTVGSYGSFNSMVVADTGSSPMLWNGLLPTTATLSSSGDQLTLTITGQTTT